MMKRSFLSLVILAALGGVQADDNAPFQPVEQEAAVAATDPEAKTTSLDPAPVPTVGEVKVEQSATATYGPVKTLVASAPRATSNKAPTVPTLPPPPIPAKAPALHMPLPGVGALPGAVPMNNTIRVRENSAESISVALRFANRIATPFANPMVIDASSWEIQKNGSSVFVKPTTAEPVAMYITGDRPGDPTISVVLVPQDIPPQTVALQLDQGKTGADSEEAAQFMKASSYNERIQAVMKAAALGKTLPGYSEGPLPRSVGRSANLVIAPEKRYSGRFDDVYVYWIENASASEIELDESMFYEDGVRAIAFYPEIRLMPGRGTRMFVMSDNGKGDE